MFLKPKTILILLIFIISIGAVSASENSTDIQSTGENIELEVSDDDVLTSNGAGTFTELEKKITALVDDEENTNYTIILDKDYSYTKGDSKEGISLVDIYDLTIDGNGKTLDGKSSARIFNIKYGSVTLKNIILKNGNAEDGGAINVEWADLIIENSSFIKNNAPKYYNGGAIFISESNVNISDSTFDSNTAYFSGGAVCFQSGKMTIDNSKFNNNYAGEMGGAIYECAGNIVVKNSLFDSNTAKESGGAISAMHFKLQNNTLINNNLPELKIIFKKFITQYKSGEVFNVTVVDKYTKQPVTDTKVALRMIHSIDEKHPSSKTFYAKTDSKGVASFKTISNLRPGYYDWGYDFEITGSYGNGEYELYEIAVNKWPTIVKAPKVVNNYKQSKYFKVTVKDKKTNKALKNINIKVKVYTGKKYKTYAVKTNKKGLAKLNTKTIVKGTHKVKISSTDKYYKVSAKSTIKIK